VSSLNWGVLYPPPPRKGGVKISLVVVVVAAAQRSIVGKTRDGATDTLRARTDPYDVLTAADLRSGLYGNDLSSLSSCTPEACPAYSMETTRRDVDEVVYMHLICSVFTAFTPYIL